MAEEIEQKQPTRWRCLVKGCRIEGVWQDVFPGETYYPSSDRRSHYGREHFPETEREYHAILAAQRESRVAYYREHGKFPPPTFD